MGNLPEGRPWHHAQVIACAHAITHTNQKKRGLRAAWADLASTKLSVAPTEFILIDIRINFALILLTF